MDMFFAQDTHTLPLIFLTIYLAVYITAFRVGRILPIMVKTTVITQFLSKYFLPRREMAERGETKFWENCHENT